MQLIYYFSTETFEYVGQGYIPDGAPIPDNGTDVAPGAPLGMGYVKVWNSGTQLWDDVEDHRGDNVFQIADGIPDKVRDLGPIDTATYTTQQPPDFPSECPTRFVWDAGVPGWQPDPLLSDKIAANARALRDALLAESDFVEGIGCPIDSARLEEFAKYRQWLRDVPSQGAFPFAINWPGIPAFTKMSSLEDANTKSMRIVNGYNYAIANPL